MYTPQLVGDVGQNAGTTGTHGMAECDSSAINVGLLWVHTQFFLDSKELGRECLVHVDQIQVLELDPGLFT